MIDYDNPSKTILVFGISISLLLITSIVIFYKYFLLKNKIQSRIIALSRENERIIREQNIILENKVEERTYELQLLNQELNSALEKLKITQAHLIESEKLSTLGRFSAVIAHEINNPLNYLKASTQIVRKNLKKLENNNIENKTISTIYETLNMLDDGLNRITTILNSFLSISRESSEKPSYSNINSILDTTIGIVELNLSKDVHIIKKYQELPNIKCYPEKLIQVFLNIIDNGIYAIHKKNETSIIGTIEVNTFIQDNNITISIQDNGIGIDANILDKIFDPFFSTKELGTGLGLATVAGIVKHHNGVITVFSELNSNTTFNISIPISQ